MIPAQFPPSPLICVAAVPPDGALQARVDDDPTGQALALARVIDRLGSDDFGAALLDWLAPRLQAAHATAFHFDAGLQARVVMTASAGGGSVALQSARLYAGSGLYRHDQLLDMMRDRPASCEALPAITRLTRADIADASYGEQLWDRYGLVDRLSALAKVDGRWTAVNLYRDQATGGFATGDVGYFTGLAPLLMALLRRHLAMRQPSPHDASAAAGLSPEAATALLRRLPVRLSARELEVCALSLTGRSREGIGLALGIAPSSVATLRSRAYRKLRVHGAVELFALCLAGAPVEQA